MCKQIDKVSHYGVRANIIFLQYLVIVHQEYAQYPIKKACSSIEEVGSVMKISE